jgi:hypothetical protein
VKLLVDEGVDAAIVARLRADGLDVLYVAELARESPTKPCLSSRTAMGASW